ncbi:MAG: hypothetical protein N2Z73_03685 [Endomicrobia bacterium]|nr:hypothetical protein [Endomicrobiia bacterium]
MLKDKDIKHKDTFNFEKYNKDVLKSVDEYNKNLSMYYNKKFSEETEYRAKHISSIVEGNRRSMFINWREGQYEEIFGHI